MNKEEMVQFWKGVDERNRRVKSKVESLSGVPFTEEELENLREMLEMGANEGSCMYGYEDADVFIGRAMAALKKASGLTQ